MRVLVACTIRDAFHGCGLDAREIEGFPGYAVTACGKVFSRNHPTGALGYFKELRGHVSPKGYRGLTLCNSSGHFPKRVHRLVASAFHPNPRGLPCVRHKNGIPGDNRAENLAWATYAENEADKLAHGTWLTRMNGKMTEADRTRARQLVAEGFNHTEAANAIGVSHSTVSRLINGKIWRDTACVS